MKTSDVMAYMDTSWRVGVFGRAFPSQWAETIGLRWDAFGISYEMDERFSYGYILTHIPTGLKICGAPTPAEAKRLAKELSKLDDWKKIGPEGIVGKPWKRRAERITALFR